MWINLRNLLVSRLQMYDIFVDRIKLFNCFQKKRLLESIGKDIFGQPLLYSLKSTIV